MFDLGGGGEFGGVGFEGAGDVVLVCKNREIRKYLQILRNLLR